MAIQVLNKVEIAEVSGGAALLNVSGTLDGLTGGLSLLLKGVLLSVGVLAASVSTFLKGLPVVGGLLGSALGLTDGLVQL